MRNWLRTKLHNFIFPQDSLASSNKLAVVEERHSVDIEGMRFTVMPADGGVIVQMRVYDRRKDVSHNKIGRAHV